MKTRLRRNALLVVVAWTIGVGASLSFAQDEIQWLDNYKDALREAKRTQRPIFLEFRCEA